MNLPRQSLLLYRPKSIRILFGVNTIIGYYYFRLQHNASGSRHLYCFSPDESDNNEGNGSSDLNRQSLGITSIGSIRESLSSGNILSLIQQQRSNVRNDQDDNNDFADSDYDSLSDSSNFSQDYTFMGNVVARVATQLLRFINYHVRHWSEQLRNPETRQQLYYPLTIGCGGAFAGSLVRRQLGAYVATFSAVWFISNFLIDYDFIKVNWERVDQVRNALPMIDYAVHQYQVLKEYAQSIPMSGVFGAGFAIGFYYL